MTEGRRVGHHIGSEQSSKKILFFEIILFFVKTPFPSNLK